jgi:SAM-dependent methyltransferase
VTLSAGLERAIGLLDPARRPKSAAVPDGYLDLLGGAGRRGGRPAQRLMLTRGLPVVYERCWRPAWGRVLMGPLAPGIKGERQIAHELLELGPGDTALDIACGPGNFVRGDASRLPFREGSFDAVCCFAALHLFDAPLAALDAMERVLAPGGRLAILTSARAPLTPAPVGALVGAATGLRVFGRDEITGALGERGLEAVQRRISGLAQFVGARKSTAAG